MYPTKWAQFKQCQHFFHIPEVVADQVHGENGQRLLQYLWDEQPETFYEHPLAILRQEWWHAAVPYYAHAGFWASLPPYPRVLDYGCGVGALCQPWIWRRQGITHLVEASDACLAYLRHKYAPYLQRKSVVIQHTQEARASDMGPIPYDALICTDVFEHVPDPMTLQTDLWALLKPGGHALLKMETAFPHAGHLQEAVEQFPQWWAWLREHTEMIETETYAWVRKPLGDKQDG